VTVRLRLVTVAALVGLMSTTSATAVSLAPAPYKNPTAGRAMALQIPGMHLAKVKRNLVYRRSPEGPLEMDVYAPRASKASRPLPAVLFVHGITNASSPKDLDQFVGWGQLAAASGFIGISFSHRQSWAGPDTKAAIKYVRANASRLGVDPERLAVQAHSWDAADGVSAALAGSPEYVQAIVVYYGVLWGSRPERSPIDYLEADASAIPPMLVAKAGLDVRDINEGIDDFMRLAVAKGAPVRLITYPKGKHSFDTLQHTEGSRRIMRASLALLGEKLAS
jgi:acetyl esterase/lipase